MTAIFSTQIEINTDGVAWVAGTRTKVLEIVLDKLAHGWSPEEIHLQHPHLSLAQIHGALTFYYEHEAELGQQIRHRLAAADRMARECGNSELRRKLTNAKPVL